MWRGIFLISSTLLLTVFCAGAAMAADTVEIRTGVHEDYSRLVFEWSASPQYSVSKSGGRVMLRFNRAAAPAIPAIDSGAKNILKIETLSSGAEPLQMAVTIPGGSRFRDFVVQNKVILDVYNPPVTEAAPVSEQEPEPEPVGEAKPVAATPPVSASAPEGASAASPEPAPAPKGAEPAASVPVAKVEEEAASTPSLAPHVITLTNTTSTGIAVYERAGSIWIAADNAALPSGPQVSGPDAAGFGTAETFPIEGGMLYRLPLPDGYAVRPEGGGLSWRLHLEPHSAPTSRRGANFIRPQAVEEGGHTNMSFPIKFMRKSLTFNDPIIGDRVTAITAPQAGDVNGRAQKFVQFETLASPVGLAFVARADDVTATIQPDMVTIGRPQGLSVSGRDGLHLQRLLDATATDMPLDQAAPETEAPQEDAPAGDVPEADAPATEPAASTEDIRKNTDEKPAAANDIYNFPKWEMGGIPALEENQRIIMMDIAGKKPEERAEDIIALAKLDLANNRAPEALGLLRIVAQEVPDLANNTEFRALRGAALALSGKYDEAINDFTDKALTAYKDVRYWQVFTLAGLEDWQQATNLLPTDLKAITLYPMPIRLPMALALAEVALRAGKVAQAQYILDGLKDALPQMALPYRSAWNYLAGELARQQGRTLEAANYWEPLVDRGEDDLYRAKAGLSLTKLQLDEKKIKPAEAIDRLEGLRFAWRGDELETLVNYRLGLMYIENKDYLKGMTVLRNAASLSPNSPMGRSIDTTLSRTFRDVFAGQHLDSVSPLEAISLYEEFRTLAPPGEEGERAAAALAERLVDAELLGRAAAILDTQVTTKLAGRKKVETAIRLAAIRLLDGNHEAALKTLDVAEATLKTLVPAEGAAAPAPESVEPQAGGAAQKTPETKQPAAAAPVPALSAGPSATRAEIAEMQRQIDLLRARALSLAKKTDEAIAILDTMRLDPDVNRLRADIAWSAGRWEEASVALGDLIIAADINPRTKLDDYKAQLLLSRGIALNLSGNRVALANLRDRYYDQMKATEKAELFEIVTRPRRPDIVGSKEAIERMITEIDLFKGFLDSYGKIDAPPANAVTTAPAADAAKPDASAAAGDAVETTP